jgi:radical SAM superfamily enzyme YgiQ (UPF0313 family)
MSSLRHGTLVLVSVPGFAHGWSPLGIARIKAFLVGKGYRVKVLPLCVLFTDFIRRRHSQLFGIDKWIGEFGHDWHELYFSGLLFGHQQPKTLLEESIRDMLENRDIYRSTLNGPEDGKVRADPGEFRAEVSRIVRYCQTMAQFLMDHVQSTDWTEVDVVGFSCVEAQFLTSIYIARHLRRTLRNRPTTVFGGPMFHRFNASALVDSFEEIDKVVVGAGEDALLELLEAGSASSLAQTRGVIACSADPDSNVSIGGDHYRLAQYPMPDYDDIRKEGIKQYTLTTCMGKGCSHWRCSFCANDDRGQYVRDPSIVFDEIRCLVQRHGKRRVYFGDLEVNGDREKLERLCELLNARGIKIDAWGEINARNTSPALLGKMKQAGLSRVQIGVESFSSSLLAKINKPATILDNVKVLKWGIEAGMDLLLFNLLCNHPLTTKSDVEETFHTIRLIAHLLRPPVVVVPNEMDLLRTSDMYARQEHYDIREVRNFRFYERMYPSTAMNRSVPMLCLEYRRHEVDPLWGRIIAFLARVRKRPRRLTVRRLKSGVRVWDTRFGAAKARVLSDLDGRVLLEAMDRIVTRLDIAETLEMPLRRIAGSVRRLRRARLLLEDRGRFLALPLYAGGGRLIVTRSGRR